MVSSDRECGDCGEPINDDDHDDLVRVGNDWFHATCYMPQTWIDGLRDVMRKFRDNPPMTLC